ncbi:MAG: IS481 family transposase, partial [Candidatus Thermoplasmatota archaeon]|nr:IS481 family transposase [Candidatus Thermoplasmatota archaeon]
MKLNPRRIRYLIRKKKQGVSSKTIAFQLKISKRRVNQIWYDYNQTGKEPIIGRNIGRPAKPLSEDEAKVIKEA